MYIHPYHYLYEQLQQLQQQIDTLKQENAELRDKIAQMRPVQIDKIEYKIHELQIQTLSGTLNVGLTANGEDTCMGEVIEKIVEEHRSNIITEEDRPEADAESSGVSP
ncbi:spore germination protein GerPC [Lihuaxuella thermophila]|uniref:Spore germination protein GerPC n=1 Tax=Lihuaxuella thermophila TaxID=1173111 RepID=A0A1H8IDV4_9BACL|nr:spore germination protein GerPC [Lihuaxuella thermophila]SEN66402.1 Spore germination protein GerPC [Lihuaxuella thermophila]